MNRIKNHLYKYSGLIIILLGIFISIYLLLSNFSYENKEPKTITLDNDLFKDDFSQNLNSNLLVENVTKLNLPFSIWDLKGFNFIDNTSFVFTLDQYLEYGMKSNTINQLKIYSNEDYEIDVLAHDVTKPIVMQDKKTLLFSPRYSNETHEFDIENKEITNNLDGRVCKILSNKSQYLLMDNDMFILQDMDTNKEHTLISFAELEKILYDDYQKYIENSTQKPLDERFYDMVLITDSIEYEKIMEKLQEEYLATGYPWPLDSSYEKLSYFPFIYLNPWDFKVSADESKIYFKVDLGADYGTIYSLHLDTKHINTIVSGTIVDFSFIAKDKLIIQGKINNNEGLFIYNTKDDLMEEFISENVSFFDFSSDGKLAYITINASGINELRISHYDGEKFKASNIAYISSTYMDFLQWSPSGDELLYISDNMDMLELLLFKIKLN